MTEREAWTQLVQGKNELLAAYRLQRQPKESTFEKIDEARECLQERFGIEVK